MPTTTQHLFHPCPDCIGPSGRFADLGMHLDGSPRICWTCQGTGTVVFHDEIEAALADYQEAAGWSVWENDHDSWLDTSDAARDLRAAYWRAHRRSV